MGAVGESIAVVALAGALAWLSERSWAWITALVVAGLLSAIALLSLYFEPYFSMRSAAFGMAFAAAAGRRRRWIGTPAGAAGFFLALVSGIWLVATGGTITIVVGESSDPSQTARIVDTIDATDGFLSTIVLGLLVSAFAVWSWR
jgi:cell division protein FtsW (lipid II flippase)